MARLILLTLLGLVSAAGSAQPTDGLADAARLYERLVTDLDGEGLTDLYDADAFLERVVEGLDLDPDFRSGFLREARHAASFPHAVLDAVAEGGTYQFLRLVDRDGEARARFRLVAAGGGLNYHDVLFTDAGDGPVRVVDAYNYLGGEDVSQTVRRVLAGSMGADGGTGPQDERARQVAAFASAAERRDYAAMVRTYPRIEVHEADHKPLLVLYLLAAAETSDAAYGKALDLFQHAFTGDPTADLVLMERHYLRGDLDAVLAALDRVDAAVGGDPYLDTFRVPVHLGAGRTAEAERAADRLLETLPDLVDGLFLRLDVALAQEDFAAATDLMLRLRREFEVEFYPEDLKREPLWEGFVASPQYKVWSRARAE